MKNTLEIVTAFPGPKSGQEMAKNSVPSVSTHGNLDKIKQRIRKDSGRYFGRGDVPHYVVRMKCGGHRGFFVLDADLDSSAKKARAIKAHLTLYGWAKTIEKFAPASGDKVTHLTIGKFLELVALHGQIEPFTFHNYGRKLRQLAAGVAKIVAEGNDKFSGTTQPSKWKTAVDAILLEKLTPTAIERWRSQYVVEKSGLGRNRTKVEHTANAIIRNARSLFAKSVLKKLQLCVPTLKLPTPLPFDGIDLLEESEADFFYFSEVDAAKLIQAAFAELKEELLVIFVLAIGAGLRRKEIDNLTWDRVDLERGIVVVAPTATAKLKSDQSAGELELEAEFLEVLRNHAQISKGEFVLRPERCAKSISTYSYYRCNDDFEQLIEWLAGKGMKRALHKVHTLRKEYGSGIAREHGIHAACASLRHSSIGLTSKFYTERKSKPTSYFKKNEKPKMQQVDHQTLVSDIVRELKKNGLEFKQSA